jgi:hypothetical protein
VNIAYNSSASAFIGVHRRSIIPKVLMQLHLTAVPGVIKYRY